MIPATTEVTLQSASDLVNVLFLDHPHERALQEANDALLFRGIGDDRHELVPTSLRTDKRSTERFLTVTGWSELPTRAEFQHRAESEIVDLFYHFADRNSLPLPKIAPSLHEGLTQDARSRLISVRSYHVGKDWPPRDLEEVVALAQHHGLPTRLLDWTTDPLVAAYFAAEGGLRRLEEGIARTSARIAIWSTTLDHLRYASFIPSAGRLSVVFPPRSGNKNLAAQRGVFTLYRQTGSHKALGVDRRTLNEIVDTRIRQADEDLKVDLQRLCGVVADEREFFFKHTLPVSETPALLSLLQARGWDAGRLFPGFSGAAQAVLNTTRIDRLRGM